MSSAKDVWEAMQKDKRIAELEDALRAIREVLQKTGAESAVATMIVATCDSALQKSNESK